MLKIDLVLALQKRNIINKTTKELTIHEKYGVFVDDGTNECTK